MFLVCLFKVNNCDATNKRVVVKLQSLACLNTIINKVDLKL